MNSVIVGIFENQTAANDARDQLLAGGFASGTVVVSAQDSATVDNVTGNVNPERSHPVEREDKGVIASFFDSIFGNDETQSHDPYRNTYQEAIRRGHYGVSVTAHSEEDMERAEEILNRCGAVDIDERSQQWRGEGWTADQTPQGMVGEKAGTLKEIQEELTVGKRSVARGGVRVFSRLVETPVEETVRLRQERVDVQRRAVDRPATEEDFAAFKEGSLEVRETSEEPVVSKQARVVGEVEVGKSVTEHEETVRGTVRQTRVEVEQLNGQGGSNQVSPPLKDTRRAR